jgi:hypothetical protein
MYDGCLLLTMGPTRHRQTLSHNVVSSTLRHKRDSNSQL